MCHIIIIIIKKNKKQKFLSNSSLTLLSVVKWFSCYGQLKQNGATSEIKYFWSNESQLEDNCANYDDNKMYCEIDKPLNKTIMWRSRYRMIYLYIHAFWFLLHKLDKSWPFGSPILSQPCLALGLGMSNPSY